MPSSKILKIAKSSSRDPFRNLSSAVVKFIVGIDVRFAAKESFKTPATVVLVFCCKIISDVVSVSCTLFNTACVVACCANVSLFVLDSKTNLRYYYCLKYLRAFLKLVCKLSLNKTKYKVIGLK